MGCWIVRLAGRVNHGNEHRWPTVKRTANPDHVSPDLREVCRHQAPTFGRPARHIRMATWHHTLKGIAVHGLASQLRLSVDALDTAGQCCRSASDQVWGQPSDDLIDLRVPALRAAGSSPVLPPACWRGQSAGLPPWRATLSKGDRLAGKQIVLPGGPWIVAGHGYDQVPGLGRCPLWCDRERRPVSAWRRYAVDRLHHCPAQCHRNRARLGLGAGVPSQPISWTGGL